MRARSPALLSVLLAGVTAVSRPSSAGEKGEPTRESARALDLAALLDRALTPEQRAERAFLEHLGWRLVVDPTASKITAAGGSPCRRADLAAAHAAGDLRVSFPPSVSAEDVARFGTTLAEIADSVASRCAWQHRVAPAVERATRRLAENAAAGRLTFPKWAVFDAPIFTMDPPEPAWVRREKVCYARERPSAAVEAFYGEDASAECYVAQTVAAYAIQYEVYGAAWFDETFAPDDLAIGQVWHLHQTPAGRTMNAPSDYPWRALFLRPADRGEDPGVVLARLGPLAFPGLTGILMDGHGTGRGNQNLTFVSVSPSAVESLLRNGGFGFVARQTRELLELQDATKAPFATGAVLEAHRRRMEAILADPVFREVRVYIHPYGVLTLGEMVDRLRRRDRVAPGLLLYDQAREDTFFQRYRRAWKGRWEKAAAAR